MAEMPPEWETQKTIELAAAWLTHNNALADGLRNMILTGRLTKADIPDDFDWLHKMLAWYPGKERVK